MTTYTTPQFATAPSARDTRLDREATPRTPYGVTDERAALAAGPTPDWQPGASKGVPKAAIGALGAAMVGGLALAIVLMAPSNKVVKTAAMPDPIAQAAADNAAARKSVDQTDAAVKQLEEQAPAAGTVAAPAAASVAAEAAPVDTAPAPVAAPAPAARTQRSSVPARRTTQDVAPRKTADTVPTPPTSVDAQTPAIQETPAQPTVTPSEAPTPAPADPAPTTPDPAPAQ